MGLLGGRGRWIALVGILGTLALSPMMNMRPVAAADGSIEQTYINQDRASAGLAPLAWNTCLANIALENAQRMAAQGFISHANGVNLDMGCVAGATSAGENVAWISSGPDDARVNTMFMNSPGHRANILGAYDYVATAWFTDASGGGYMAEEFLMAPAGADTPAGRAVAVASWASGRLDVFARGANNALMHRWFDSGVWSAWESLGGQLTSDPAAVSWGPGRIDVFARGTDNSLMHTWYDGKWNGWQSLGGVLTASPGVASWASGRLDVVVRGGDNGIWHLWWDGLQWSAWQPLGGHLTSGPSAASWSANRLDIFARGLDNGIWHKYWDGSWHEWQSLGGTLTSGVAVTAWGSGRLDLFARGVDGGMWHLWYSGAWSGWESQAGQFISDPAVVAWGLGRLDVFGQGTDNALWHKYYASAWSGWQSMGSY
ncbi:MAG: CAP domain-containing protein [Candidatus Dormibacter sp.]